MFRKLKTFILRHKKKILCLLLCLLFSAVAATTFLWYCNHVISSCSSKCYTDIATVPERSIALVPGTAKYFRSGRINQYFSARTEAAAQLYLAGKVKHILISGDNSRKDYDEPSDMKEAIVTLGVPPEAITLDYAGFRTLDSVVRAKVIFGCQELIIVSQQFHAERAIYIAGKHGIDAIGFAADDPGYWKLKLRVHSREILARAAAWIDVNIIKREPKFYGEPLPILQAKTTLSVQ